MKVLTKKELAGLIGISSSTLRRWLNELYYEEIEKIGYNKNDRILKPQIVKWLCEHLAIELT